MTDAKLALSFSEREMSDIDVPIHSHEKWRDISPCSSYVVIHEVIEDCLVRHCISQ